jgi:hypothetical protein
MLLDSILPALDLPVPPLRSEKIKASLKQSEFHSIVERLEQGDAQAEGELRVLLRHYPSLWKTLGDVGQHLENHLLDVIGAGSKIRRWAAKEFIEKVRNDLLAGGDSLLEQILIHRIIISHLEVTIRTIRANAAITATSARRRERLLNSAIRRQIAAVQALGELRAANANSPS